MFFCLGMTLRRFRCSRSGLFITVILTRTQSAFSTHQLTKRNSSDIVS